MSFSSTPVTGLVSPMTVPPDEMHVTVMLGSRGMVIPRRIGMASSPTALW